MDDQPDTRSLMLTDTDMPPRFHEANQAAIRAQHRFLLVVRVQIISLVIPVLAGSVAAAISGQDWLTYVALIGLIVVATTRLIQRFSGQESAWHSERATAEAIRATTWLYSVGGHPFDTMAEVQASLVFHEQLADLDPGENPRQDLAKPGVQVTDGMNALRSATFATRKEAYATGRLADQRSWYASKAAMAERRGRQWDIVFVTSSGLAILFGVLHVSGLLAINLISVFGITAAVIGTWTGVRQFGSISATYSNTVVELSQLEKQLTPVTEPSWGAFVETSEEVMSREHSAWTVKRK